MVTVIAAPIRPGVKPDTTPGVLVNTGGAAAAGEVSVQLQPSEAGGFGGTAALLGGAGAVAAAGAGLDAGGLTVELQPADMDGAAVDCAGAGAAAGRLPPGPGPGTESGL